MPAHAPIVDREKGTVTIWNSYYNTSVTYTFEFIEDMAELMASKDFPHVTYVGETSTPADEIKQ